MLDRMDGIASLAAALALAGGGSNMRPVSDKKLNDEFAHIKDLKEGEALRLVKNSSLKVPRVGDTVIVYRVLENTAIDGLGSEFPVKRYDFTALVQDISNNSLMEYSFDSRYFERITA